MHLKIKSLTQKAKDFYENHGHFHQGDAGLDLFIIDSLTIPPGETAIIKSNIACENTDEMPYLLMPRSSISKTPLRQCNSVGLIDAGYRGEIISAFDNHGSEHLIHEGDRVVQICPPDLAHPMIVSIVDSIHDLGDQTSRGSGGFGSTGK